MFFIDELQDIKMYKRSFLLPLNEKDKRHGSASILFGPTEKSNYNIINYSFMTPKYYNGYYIEKAVMYYVNNETKMVEECVDRNYINEAVQLFDDPKVKIEYIGYDNYVSQVKKILNTKYFEKTFKELKVDIKKIKNISIKIQEDFRLPNKNIIYLVPEQNMNKAFKTYENYCKFAAYFWILLNINPDIDENLAGAIALKESDSATKYKDKDWPFSYNMGVLVRGLYLYEETNGRPTYIKEIIKGHNGTNKLQVTLYDLLYMLKDDIKKAITLEATEMEDSISLNEDTYLILNEVSGNPILKKILFKNRIKSIKELKEKYEEIKEKYPEIKYTYIDLSMYNRLNLFVDCSRYNESFVRNSTLKNKKGFDNYTTLMSRMINDSRLEANGYNEISVIIPVLDWYNETGCQSTSEFLNITKSINPLSCIYKMMVAFPERLKTVFGNKTIIFTGLNGYMKIDFSKFDPNSRKLFYRNINTFIARGMIVDNGAKIGANATSSARAIKMDIIDKIETSRNIKIDDISVEDKKAEEPDKPKKKTSTTDKKEKKPKTEEEQRTEKLKKDLVKTVDDASKNKTTTQSALDTLDNDEDKQLQKILSDLATNADSYGSNISGARASRMLKLQNDFLDSEIDGKKVSEIINTPSLEEVKPLKLNIDSVNKEWQELTFAKTLESYDINKDILSIFGSFHDATNAMVVREISKEDTSTSEDLIYTYTVKYETANGERFTVKVDMPKFVDGKYMRLRGNRKNIPIQMFLMPIIKTDEDTVQIVSCYNKIFVRRFGTTSGKSNVCADKLIKTLSKNTYKNIKVTTGDNTRVCSKYEVPMDYIDLSGVYSKIETKEYVFLFNQDELRKKFKVDDSKGLCVGYNKKNKELLYFSPNPKEPIFFSYWLYLMISTSDGDDKKFAEDYKNASKSVRYCYSRASIMNSKIPLVVICAYSEGLEPVLKKANIKYTFSTKRPSINYDIQDMIKFNDGFLVYDLNYASSLLMNGLKACNTEDYSLTEINSKPMYLDFLDMFGGRIKADGLDNFYDCMIDPITRETLTHYKLPTDYVSVLLQANLLLSDNKFIKHGDIRASRRFRREEQIVNFLYIELARAYGAYSTGLKHGRKVPVSLKQSCVIDAILTGNTTEDQSILNALGEYEAYYTVTPRGVSGMNSDRSYSLDKRSFDDSMMNVLSASTGFAGNVGINRQATIDANIEGSRGYVYNDPETAKDEINGIKTLSMTEALTPFGATRDDPMRQAMGFVQTSKHGMRCVHSDPLLISNGADEALPYLVSNTFAYKAKAKGTIEEIVDDKYMIIKYDKPIKGEDGKDITHDYIKLDEEVQKNSSSGFYVPLKLDTDLKVGSKVKEGQIVAYDKKSFSNEIGSDKNIAYNIGTLAKFAILNTDEGFEDSAIVSDDLANMMASDVILEKEIVIPKDANIYNLVTKGQKIQEGDSLLIIQNSYDEEDTNALLRNLNGSEDEITELGRKRITSSVTGTIQDIVICRTVDDNELSPTLKKVVKAYEKTIKEQKDIMKKYGIEDDDHSIPDLGKLPATGKLKHADDSVVIRIYMKYFDKFSVGDKMIYGTAVKGVCKQIFPKGKEPYSEYRKDEKIHALLSIGSINARMVTSVLITTGMNKALIELSRKCKKMAGLPDEINLI